MCTTEGNTGNTAATGTTHYRLIPSVLKGFYRHYSGKPALTNRHYRGITTVTLFRTANIIPSFCVLKTIGALLGDIASSQNTPSSTSLQGWQHEDHLNNTVVIPFSATQNARMRQGPGPVHGRKNETRTYVRIPPTRITETSEPPRESRAPLRLEKQSERL